MINDPEYYVQGVCSGDRKVLAKTITLVESSLPEHQELVTGVLDRLLPFTGRAVRLGITGVPGVGKSTFIECLGMNLLDGGHLPVLQELHLEFIPLDDINDNNFMVFVDPHLGQTGVSEPKTSSS